MSLKAIAHFEQYDPILAKVTQQVGPLPDLVVNEDYFTALTGSIIGQQISTHVANVVRRRFLDLFGATGLLPERLLQLSDDQLRAVGISWSKVRYLKDLATKVQDGTVQLTELQQLDNEEIIARLVQVKGIGRWTVEMFLIFTLRRPDVFSFGDGGLQRALKRVYGFDELPSQAELLLLTQKWSPYRSYASRVLWKSLELPDS